MSTVPNGHHAKNVPTFADVLDGYQLEDTWWSRRTGRHRRVEPDHGSEDWAEWQDQLEVETLVSTSPRGREQLIVLRLEQRAVVELCHLPRSVAEVAAVLRLPLSSTRGLLDEMAGRGLVAVHRSIAAQGGIPDLMWMERVLSGLRQI
ncbi:hypothetical protein GCM10023321_13210 [Pseudonocardia eucalypti]|uniref:DUF742 domain-containing protein n=1 Tax=Pseudonocardia eucalypti TaxID=648755 RepID=A0ABP9PN52_9PSEU|nr:hypothetical protein [Pseudonocardia eucalypti]